MKRMLALVTASAVFVVACGSNGDDAEETPRDEPRTIAIAMTDMAYTPSRVDAEPGETVTFVFRNDGAVRHEAVFGDLTQQESHHAEMTEMGGSHDGTDMGSMPHDQVAELHSVIVEPGETVEVRHTFDDRATMIGCHEPGHWEAGMKMDIGV